MDKDRQIRFLYPPFILIFSLIIGLIGDTNKSISDIICQIGLNGKLSDVIIILIGGGVSLLVLGYIIGTITMSFLRLIFILAGRNYEVVLKTETYENIKKIMDAENCKCKFWYPLYLVATFDHVILPNRIHEWLLRRWNSFNTSMNSVVALLLSIIPIKLFDIELSCIWWLVISIIGILLLINGIISWIETMGMFEFQSNCRSKSFNKHLE